MKNEQHNQPLQSEPDSGKRTATEPSSPSSLEEVRKRLQSFGYLNTRIERFYLSSLSKHASRFLNRALLSLRVGLLSGTLAAILMTVGTLVFNDELFQKKLDVALLFVYFEVFFVLLFSLLEFLLIFAVSVLLRFIGDRRLIVAGQAISFFIGVGFFSYFLYWGQTQTAYLRLLPMSSIITMFVILTLSCLFVAKCSWLGFLVAFRELKVLHPPPDWKRYSIEVLLSLTAVMILLPFLMAARHENKEEQAPPPLAVVSTPDKWIVIGIDGVSQEIIKRFSNSGNILHIEKLSSDSFFAELDVSEPVIPPVSWTTVATGVPPAEHGILMPEVRRWRGLSSWMQITPLQLAMRSILVDAGFGQRQPVSGYSRKVKTFWEILSDSGIRIGVVNWWGSWPAQPLRGWNISERYYYKLISREKAQDETFPPALFHAYSVPMETKKISGPELDRFYTYVFQQQLRKDPVRVAALYLPGFDILNHEFFENRALDPFTYSDAYKAHLEWLDKFLESTLSSNPGYRLLIIFHKGRSLKNDHSALLVHDASTSHSRPGRGFSETEVVPLLLYSCGLPISRSMNTALIQSILSTESFSKAPIRYVSSFLKEEKQIQPAHIGEFNDVLVEQMKSLGYLQ